ncbi:molybdenum cofactor guanylyltransferase [candidate division KSB1 bacterium]|nr:molybdenum cofactor guanylyltransferase [candidate division KSB1 bacterium]
MNSYFLENTSSAIIAGGNSKRFGSTKLYILFRQKRLIDYAIELAHQLTNHTCIIVGNAEITNIPDIPQYKDIFSNCGPIGGIYTALVHSPTARVVILPCDMPFLSVAIYRILSDNSIDTRPVIAVSPDGIEPVVSIWHQSSIPAFEVAIQQKQYSLRPLMQELDANFVDLINGDSIYHPDWFRNINRMEDILTLENIPMIDEQ